ncbi:hypothetical protein [Pontivivens nitratireducens]|uniref:hypothetical protein n=1 Tax=Pontivivens nitratireducens TaxID=2758038 RepID=UPI00163B2F7D|nr:hypothetical protein [Pontibrevibacter nitratireducens]
MRLSIPVLLATSIAISGCATTSPGLAVQAPAAAGKGSAVPATRAATPVAPMAPQATRVATPVAPISTQAAPMATQAAPVATQAAPMAVQAAPIATQAAPMAVPVPAATGINFGNDSGSYPFDGECDDPRFRGAGMAVAASLSSSNRFRDASDCQTLFNAGLIFL